MNVTLNLRVPYAIESVIIINEPEYFQTQEPSLKSILCSDFH